MATWDHERVTTPRPPARPADADRAKPVARHIPLRVWVLGGVIAALVLITATGGVRGWWAHRLHDMTGGNNAIYVFALPQ